MISSRWHYSFVLLVGYLITFHVWALSGPVSVAVTGALSLGILGAFHWKATVRHYFANACDNFLHAVVLLDIFLEMILIKDHQRYGFYACAFAFAAVIGIYRWIQLRKRTAESV